MRIIGTVFLFLISLPGLALETDNYIVWGHELHDSAETINRYLRDQILQTLLEQKSKVASCEEVTKAISRKFQSRFVHDNPVENYLFGHLSNDFLFPTSIYYVEKSIYRNPYLFYIPRFGLAPSIQVNGYYFGTDKLSHFAWVGYLYYSKYRKALDRGFSMEEAEIKGIDYGVRDEKSLHGFWASGVFSYADLEANYQGFLFYRRLCSQENSYLQQTENKRWVLAENPDIRDFVSGDWDESFNLSYFVEKNWKKIAPVLSSYCRRHLEKSVQDRFGYYRKTQTESFSERNLKLRKNLPSPQDFQKTCQR